MIQLLNWPALGSDLILTKHLWKELESRQKGCPLRSNIGGGTDQSSSRRMKENTTSHCTKFGLEYGPGGRSCKGRLWRLLQLLAVNKLSRRVEENTTSRYTKTSWEYGPDGRICKRRLWRFFQLLTMNKIRFPFLSQVPNYLLVDSVYAH